MRKSHKIEDIQQAIEPTVEMAGYQLIDLVWGTAFNRRTLTLFVDKPGGILLEECQSLARQVGDFIEAEDLVAGTYVLEVSSPGAERRLKTAADYVMFTGRYARILTSAPIEGLGTYEMHGYLRGFAEDAVLCETEAGELVSIPLGQITTARLAIKF